MVSAKVCPQLHLPLQSGSDRVLKEIKKGFTAAESRGWDENYNLGSDGVGQRRFHVADAALGADENAQEMEIIRRQPGELVQLKGPFDLDATLVTREHARREHMATGRALEV